jgi:hypothetical protein
MDALSSLAAFAINSIAPFAAGLLKKECNGHYRMYYQIRSIS